MPFAWASLLIGLFFGPLFFCVLPIGRSSLSIVWTVLALAPQVTAIVLGLVAWRHVEKDSNLAGRGMALTAVVTGSITCLLIVLLNFYGARLGS